MICKKGTELQEYIQKLGINPKWEERDFVSYTRKYIQQNNLKVLAIGGLRGTGKTTGLLQAIKNTEACYISAQIGETETGIDYINLIKQTKENIIVLDEYSWITNREYLDKYLYTAVQNGKRIIITGTESITLDFLNYGTLIHRVDMVHVTLFTYEEFCRIYHKPQNKKSCKEYLLQGGIFKEYAITNFSTMQTYIKTAIIDNLTAYMKNLDSEKAKALVYAVFYKAICPDNLNQIPVLTENKLTMENFLDEMGVNPDIAFDQKDLKNISDILEQIGVIIRIPNYDKQSPIKEQYYIVNPSLTCQLILAAYKIPEITNDILGHAFEACCLIQLYHQKLSDHKLYFVNTTINGKNKELDGVIVTEHEDYVYLFECKFREQDKISPNATIMSKDIEEMFPDSIIDGRYVIYNGVVSAKTLGDKQIIFVPIGNQIMNQYYYFSKYIQDLPEQPQKKQHTHHMHI